MLPSPPNPEKCLMLSLLFVKASITDSLLLSMISAEDDPFKGENEGKETTRSTTKLSRTTKSIIGDRSTFSTVGSSSKTVTTNLGDRSASIQPRQKTSLVELDNRKASQSA